MSDLALPIKRVRLELDRTLRTRKFFARAVTGRLVAREYHDLLDQLGWLIEALTRGSHPELPALGRADADDLAVGPARGLSAAPCPAVRLASAVTRDDVIDLREVSVDACVAVLGTSWTSDAGESLSRTFPGATRLLDELADRSRGSLLRVTDRLTCATHDPHAVYAFAELARGAVLGLATYLDLTWPPPELQLTFDGSDDHARAHAS